MKHSENDKTAPAAIEPHWVDVKGAARIVHCSVRSFWDLAKDPSFPPAKRLGRSMVWSVAQLDAYVERQQDVRPGSLRANSAHLEIGRRVSHEQRRKKPSTRPPQQPAELAKRRADHQAGREVLPAPFSNH